jgi:hypothetical protein
MFGAAKEAVPLRRADIGGVDLLVMGSLAALVVALGIVPSRVLAVVESAIAVQLDTNHKDGTAAPIGSTSSQGDGENADVRTISLAQIRGLHPLSTGQDVLLAVGHVGRGSH